MLFWQNNSSGISVIRNKYQDFSKEELAEGFSLLFFNLCDKFGAQKLTLGVIDSQRVLKGHYLKILCEFAKIVFFKYCEILVDRFEYSAIRNKSEILLEAPDPLLEKAIRLGYIHQKLQSFGDYHSSTSHSGAPSLEKLTKNFSAKFKDKLFSLKTSPIKRIVFEIPFVDQFKEMITDHCLYKEEVSEIFSFQKEFLINHQQIKEVPIFKSLTLFDLVLYERFIRLIFWAYQEFITSNNLKNTPLFVQSVLPVSSIEQLLSALGYLFGNEKAVHLLELLSWKPESSTIFDLQASPIIKIGKWTIYPISLTAHTNLARNLLQKIRFRHDSAADIDPVSDELEKALRIHTSQVYKSISYSWEGEHGEIDIFTVIDKKVFVFECKNSLLPCNNFELRTSFDYIQKAGVQLTRFKKLFQKRAFVKYFSNKLGCENLNSLQITSCIVMGNRMFSGWEEQGHKVRSIHELCNLLETGSITSHMISSEIGNINLGKFRVWEEKSFKMSDLDNFINNDTLHKLRINRMVPHLDGISIRGKKLMIRSYMLNTETLHDEFKRSFPFERED